jgi:hypothetical protein
MQPETIYQTANHLSQMLGDWATRKNRINKDTTVLCPYK